MELATYIFHSYHRLLTKEELAAYRSLLGETKIEGATDDAYKEMQRKFWTSEDPQVLELWTRSVSNPLGR